MKFIQSKWFQWGLGILGVGGSLFSLFHFGHWKDLTWPGIYFVLFLLLLVGFEMACRSLRLKRVCELAGQKISFWESTWVGALGDVYGAATPSSVGGELSRLAALARFDIRGSKAIIVLASERLVLLSSLIFVMVLSFFLIFMKEAAVFSKSLLYTLLLYVGLTLGLIVLLMVMVRHKKMQMPLKKLLLRPDIFLLAMSHHIVRLGFLPLILWMFAQQTPTLSVLVWSFVLSYGISLLPIPSGGGSVELTFMTVFKSFLGEDMASLILLWWRFSGHYFYVLVGIFVTFIGIMRFSKRTKL